MGNQFKSVAVVLCMKTFLFIFNILFWMSGMVLMLAGIWAEFDLHRYMELSPEFSGTATHVMIGIAALILLVSAVAFSCIVHGNPVLLFIYGGFLACIFVMDVGVGAAVACYQKTYPKSLRDGLTNTVMADNPFKNNFDFAQRNLGCCGVSNYSDWIRLSTQKVIPISCCVDPKNCMTANYNDVYQQGCYDAILAYVYHHINTMVLIAIGAASLPLMGTILACLLANYLKRSKYDGVNE